jgi:ABC-type transport system substrate-binding protein
MFKPLAAIFRQVAASVDAGRLDLIFDFVADQEQAGRYLVTGLGDRVFEEMPIDGVVFMAMNVALPPFDDVHVRRAMNYIVDREALVADWHRAGLGGEPATHMAPDSTEDDLLADTPGRYGTSGDAERAMEQMRLAPRYDTDGDGLCDVPACAHVPVAMRTTTPTMMGLPPGVGPFPSLENPWPAMTEEIIDDLRQIGIRLELRRLDEGSFWERVADPRNKTALALNVGWGKDYPNASTVLPLAVDGRLIGSYNYSLVGARSEDLRAWGYEVTRVPNVDDRLGRCMAEVGHEQFECWAALDQYLMDQVVPWVPYLFPTTSVVVSERVATFSWDQFGTLPALDLISLTPEAIASP